MKTNFLKSILGLTLASILVTGCVNDDSYSVPNLECNDPGLVANKTIEQIYAQATTSAVAYAGDDIIEARLVSSDKGGNFFKIMYLTSLDGTRGFSLAVNRADLYNEYNVGRKVFIKMKGLYTQIRNNTLQIGALYEGNVGQIAEADYKKSLISSCNTVNEETLVQEITLSQINDSQIGKLVELKDVQFAETAVGKPYYNPAGTLVGGQTNHNITDATGATLIFRTGSFAEYGSIIVPENSGRIRGILTKFGTTYQFISRYTTDLKLTNPRLGEEPGNPGNPGNPGGPSAGAAFVFPGGDFENFAAFVASINSYGLSTYATQSAGTGRDGSNSLFVSTTGVAANGYVFTTRPYAGLPTAPTKIQFYIKGTAAKTFSFNVYKTDGTYYPFNLESATANKTLTAVPIATNNQYTGTIDTAGQWILVTLDLTGLTDISLTDTTKNFFAVKVGKDAAYSIHFDNFTIE